MSRPPHNPVWRGIVPMNLGMNRSSINKLACVIQAMIVVLGLPLSASGQALHGEWVNQSQAVIQEHRKTDVQIVVLDENDRAVLGAQVHVEQLRHDFVIGLTLPVDRAPPDALSGQPVWRCVNAVSLDRLTQWTGADLIEPGEDPVAVARDWIRAIGPDRIVYGRVISADAGKNPDALLAMSREAFQDALLQRFDDALGTGRTVYSYDLYSDCVFAGVVEQRLGYGMLNRLYDTAQARRPDAQFNIRVNNGLDMRRSRDMFQRVQALQLRQIHFDGITIDQQFNARVQALSLARTLNDRVHTLPVPVTIVGLEVGGASSIAAAFNFETVLRLLFAQPNITGIYLAGMTAEDLDDPSAALIGEAGRLTASGQVFDDLFHRLWWTDLTEVSDDLGNISARVFAGTYRLTATLPDGRVCETEVHLPKADEPRRVVLQVGPVE